MKRIAIFCDGTWRRSDGPHPTNVVLAAQAVATDGRGGVAQQVLYLPGVGSGRGTGTLARSTDRVLGGLTGAGLTGTIAEGYRYLAFNYARGDEIYVFGYSRGAFSARSLVGLIRNCGIPKPDAVADIPHAIAHYRSRAKAHAPDTRETRAFQERFAAVPATADAEAGLARFNRLTVRYVGVWDTVGALGIPGHLPFAPRLNRRYAFHDHALSSLVEAARHAVAIDERRANFEPTLWSNLDRLEAEHPDGPGHYRQEWFPGVHGAVGGGGAVTGLSSAALLWVLEGARAQGLALRADALRRIEDAVDPRHPLDANWTATTGARARLERWMARDRDGPAAFDGISREARLRWHMDADEAGWAGPYRPAPLRRHARAIEAWRPGRR